MMVAFIDACREDFGVEPICAQLPIAPSSYYDARSRPVSARARRHAAMTVVLVALWAANYRVYGARKLWLAARRAGHEIGRDQVAALMRAARICGVTRRRRARTTVRDPGAERPGDLVNRDFTARSPNRLWVTDLTVAPTRTGAAYVCFIVDAFSRLIVGWRVAAHMRTEMVLDAVEMARRGRGARIEGLTVHSDAAQFTSIRYTERLAELTPPIHRTPPGPHTANSPTEDPPQRAFVPGPPTDPSFDAIVISFRCVSSGSHMFVFSSHTRPAHSETSPATLTTPALNRRSLRWFGISAPTATPQDPPPSLAQHRSCRRSSTSSSSLPFRTHMGAQNLVVGVDLQRCQHPHAHAGLSQVERNTQSRHVEHAEPSFGERTGWA